MSDSRRLKKNYKAKVGNSLEFWALLLKFILLAIEQSTEKSSNG